MIQVREYIDDDGRNHFAMWRATLEPVTRARVDVSLDRLERGNKSAMKSIGAGVAELRLNFDPGFRVYCGMDGEALVILLAGGTKQRQHVDVALAKTLWKQYKQGKRS